jgi:cysteine desulfurase
MGTKRSIYLDNNATTPVDPEVLDAMLPYFKNVFGNPSSIHNHGRLAKRGLERAREQAASIINADPEEIIFTSGATEANNMAILGHQQALLPARAHILTSTIEHYAVLNPVAYLDRNGLAEVSYAVVKHNGVVNLEQFTSAVQNHATMVSVMAANNDVGTIQPLAKLAASPTTRCCLSFVIVIREAKKRFNPLSS